MAYSPQIRAVVSDANVLINLIHVARLDLCGRLPGYEFVVPDNVRDELTREGQRDLLDDALARGVLRAEAITDPGDIAQFAELTAYLGRGEAACLVLAERNGWLVLSDDKRRFRWEAERRIGADRLVGTADLYVLAIRTGLLSVEDADRDKALLEARRFRMPFASFRQFVDAS